MLIDYAPYIVSGVYLSFIACFIITNFLYSKKHKIYSEIPKEELNKRHEYQIKILNPLQRVLGEGVIYITLYAPFVFLSWALRIPE